MIVSIQDIKKLREETGAGVSDVKKALEDAQGNFQDAKKELMEKGLTKAASKADRTAKDGLIYAYIHLGGKIGTLVHLACETDFVAKTDDFKGLCKEIAMQVSTDEYDGVDGLLAAEYIRDPDKKVSDVVNEAIAKLGEKIEIKKFVRYSISD